MTTPLVALAAPEGLAGSLRSGRALSGSKDTLGSLAKKV